MKYLILLFTTTLVMAAEVPKQRICILEQIIKKETCTEEKHPITGASLGWLVLGPLGAVAGAVIGSNPDKTCKTVEEKTCVKWEEKTGGK